MTSLKLGQTLSKLQPLHHLAKGSKTMVAEYEVIKLFDKNGYFGLKDKWTGNLYYYHFVDIGKLGFFTKEEAEEQLGREVLKYGSRI